MLEARFKFTGLQVRLHFYYKETNFAKFLKTTILKDICERLLLNFTDSKSKKYRKNRDVSRADNQRRIQNPVKNLRWSFLQRTIYYLFHRVMNKP